MREMVVLLRHMPQLFRPSPVFLENTGLFGTGLAKTITGLNDTFLFSTQSDASKEMRGSELQQEQKTSGPNTGQTSSESGREAKDYTSQFVPKIVVFGGSGFVGSKICEKAVDMGADVVSVSRSGKPSFAQGQTWAEHVEWIRSDVTKEDGSWRGAVKDAAGVVSTIGAFGSNAFMYKMCGQVNMDIMHVAKEAKVPRFAFISVHDYVFPGGWHAKNFLLRGYFQGKRDAEAKLMELYPDGGVALRPGVIYGTRHAGGFSIPLWLVGAPLAKMLKPLPTKNLASVPILGAAFVPPISVDSLGKAAAHSVLDPSVPPGIMDVWDMAKF